MEYRLILKKISRKGSKDKIPACKEFLCALAKP
jgi:hypothetical protein